VNVLVTGATGYIGGRLIPRLVNAGHRVRALARDSDRLAGRFDGVEIVEGDIFERESILAALRGIEVAYYLVHSMGRSDGDFAARDLEAARIFSEAARDAGVARVVFLGGLGVGGPQLSHHLRSRHETGKTLRAGGVPVTEFRAAIIVGSGSASFEMLRYLTDRLPVMIAPKWVATLCQPIAVRDVLAYLVAELERDSHEHATFEIGGADVLSYRQMMLRYAAIRGLKRSLLVVPFFTPRLSSAWVHLVTPIPSSIARPLIDGLTSPVIVHDLSARRAFPAIVPIGYDAAVRRALDRYSTVGPETTWFDAYDVDKLPGNFTGTEQGMLIDRRQVASRASCANLFATFTRLGGKRGWLYADWLWEFRGVLDRLVGGIGTRRGRRSESSLRVGDAVDFWRVEAYQKDKLLRLRAEMKLPGYAWLQFEALPATEGGQTYLRQTAFFEPRGIFGYLYWFGVLPFHGFIFGNMAKRIASYAEAQSSGDPSPVEPAPA
jgi:uncharacterized protein YbjT (DUF2867 family)